MSDLPTGWIEVPLMDFLQFLPTGVPHYNGEKEYYSTGSIQNSNYIPEGKFTFDNRPSRANRLSKVGDVFQARMKGTDKGLLIEERLNDKLFSTGFIQLRPYEKTYESKLLYYFVKSKIFIDQKDELATGSTQEALTDTKAKELKILVPPLNEQKRIVEKLDKLLARVDEAKARLEKIPVIIKRFRQSVLNAAVTGELTKDWREKNGIDDNTWIEKNINEVILDLRYGTAKASVREKLGFPTIRIPNIGEFNLNVVDMKYTNLSNNEFEKLKLQVGDILLIRSNGSVSLVGKSAIVRESEQEFVFAGYLIRLRVDQKKINPEYLNFVLHSTAIRKQIEIPARSTSGVNNINSEEVRSLKFLLPLQLEEQKEIVQRVEALFKKADEIEERYKKAKAFVDKLTQSILAKAFRGELVPQDPNDEPAEKLLERIKAMKNNETKNKNIKTKNKK